MGAAQGSMAGRVIAHLIDPLTTVAESGWRVACWHASGQHGVANEGEGAMARVHQIEVKEGKTIEETADWLAMSVSAVLHELFPDQWQQAMTLTVQRINETGR
jgi:hypothetical protein